MIGARGRPGRWSFWTFNWLIHHKTIAALERAAPHASGTLLDVGCATKPFAPVLAPRVDRYLGIDLPDSRFVLAGPPERRPDVYGRAEALPFRDASLDTVLGLSMITYLPEPGVFLAEAGRVLRPGGALILEFTQMAPLHDEPHDYFRYTRYGAAWLLERAGFTPVEVIPIGGLWARVGLSMIAALNRVNRGPTRVLTEIPVRLLYVVLQLGCALAEWLFFDPREALSHLVVARKR